MKYRKKPVVIEAWQWLYSSEKHEKLPAWVTDALNKWPEVGGISFEPEHQQGPRVRIATLEGVMVMLPGEFMVRGIKGEIYCCKPDIFDMTYETMKE